MFLREQRGESSRSLWFPVFEYEYKLRNVISRLNIALFSWSGTFSQQILLFQLSSFAIKNPVTTFWRQNVFSIFWIYKNSRVFCSSLHVSSQSHCFKIVTWQKPGLPIGYIENVLTSGDMVNQKTRNCKKFRDFGSVTESFFFHYNQWWKTPELQKF